MNHSPVQTTVAQPGQQCTTNYKILLLLSLGHLATDLNQGALPVILPLLKDTYNLSYAVAGLIPFISSFSSSIVQPLFGLLSDRMKCFWLLPAGCFAAALGIALLGTTNNYLLILSLILLSGLGVAAYHPEGAKAAHFAAGGQRASAMSVFSVGGNLGFACGSIVMAKLLAGGGLSHSIYMLVPGLLVSLLLLSRMAAIPCGLNSKTPGDNVERPAKQNKVLPLLTVMGIVITRSWVQSGLSFYIPFYYINYLKTDQLYASTILFVFLLAGAVGTLAGGPLSDRFGRKQVIVASMLLLPPLLLIFIYAKSILSMVALFTAGAVLVSTFSTTIVLGQEYLPNNVGIASGLMIGFAVGTGGIGVMLLGALADATSEHLAMVIIALLPLLGAGLGALLPREQQA